MDSGCSYDFSLCEQLFESAFNSHRGLLSPLRIETGDSISYNDNNERYDWVNGCWAKYKKDPYIFNVDTESWISNHSSPAEIALYSSENWDYKVITPLPIVYADENSYSSDIVITDRDKNTFIQNYVTDEVVNQNFEDVVVISDSYKMEFIAEYVDNNENVILDISNDILPVQTSCDSQKTSCKNDVAECITQYLYSPKVDIPFETAQLYNNVDPDDFENDIREYISPFFEKGEDFEDPDPVEVKTKYTRKYKKRKSRVDISECVPMLMKGNSRTFRHNYYLTKRTLADKSKEKLSKNKSVLECVAIYNLPKWAENFLSLNDVDLKEKLLNEPDLTITQWYMLFKLRVRQLVAKKRILENAQIQFPLDVYRLKNNDIIKKYLKEDNPDLKIEDFQTSDPCAINSLFKSMPNPVQLKIARLIRNRERNNKLRDKLKKK